MKFALISDIHGNAVALDAVLRDIDKCQVDGLLVLGDLVYRGPEPKRVLTTLRSTGATVIGGNADTWVARGIADGEAPEASLARMREEREWTVRQLTDEDLDFLASLPTVHTVQLDEDTSMLLCHATPANRLKTIPPEAPEEELFPLFFGHHKGLRPRIVAYGHIHVPFVRAINGSVLLNTGSVGMSFDHHPMPSYALVEYSDEGVSFQLRRVNYGRDQAIAALHRAAYPHAEHLATCYQHGVRP